MPITQNLCFAATVESDAEFDHPAGAALMRKLSRELSTAGWMVETMDNWRDCGWSATCRRASAELEIVVSQVEPGQWMLQISPSRVPGFLGRLFGGKLSATASDVHELALAVHHALSTLQYLGNPQWCWDGMPGETPATPEPQAP